jgi:hypothetical protein
MLEILEKLASKLQAFRKPSLILAIFFLLGAFVQLVLFDAQYINPSYEMTCFVVFIWLLLFNIMLSVFNAAPSINRENHGMFERFKIKFKRSLLHLSAFLFICLTVVIIFLTLRFLRV